MTFEEWWADPETAYACDFPSSRWIAEKVWSAATERAAKIAEGYGKATAMSSDDASQWFLNHASRIAAKIRGGE